MEMDFWNMMKEEGFVWLKEKKSSFGANLKEAYNYSTLHLNCED